MTVKLRMLDASGRPRQQDSSPDADRILLGSSSIVVCGAGPRCGHERFAAALVRTWRQADRACAAVLVEGPDLAADAAQTLRDAGASPLHSVRAGSVQGAATLGDLGAGAAVVLGNDALHLVHGPFVVMVTAGLGRGVLTPQARLALDRAQLILRDPVDGVAARIVQRLSRVKYHS